MKNKISYRVNFHGFHSNIVQEFVTNEMLRKLRSRKK